MAKGVEHMHMQGHEFALGQPPRSFECPPITLGYRSIHKKVQKREGQDGKLKESLSPAAHLQISVVCVTTGQIHEEEVD